ncbi:integral membrane protein DUF92-domain-containing protein [Triangularia verruculosa]|uniref:Integral membrane protein DUF92-domain-containing protein n=1 Tax=Triangularia verruculosa TaxID=2587418 RepID=A0AAN7AX32_9PEZI|nr:integral membrane protein DUF92-domain-containing protein [Triangularia verruculosa]
MRFIIAAPATLALVYRAYSKNSLTPLGILAAALTAIAHAVHPWNLPFVLLVVFFLAGTRATHVKENMKATLTLKATGSTPSGSGEGPRTHVQVFANSLTATILTLLHAYQLHARKQGLIATGSSPDNGTLCFSWKGDLLVIGIIANYACVAADTFSSELGILSKSSPRLITSWNLKKVPRGTNGGVTLVGLGAGLLGSMIIVTTSVLFLPFCTDLDATLLPGGGQSWDVKERQALILGLTVWGLLGSVMDSVLGGLFQRSVKDVRSGKIVEGEGGERVLVASPVVIPGHGNAQKSEQEAVIGAEVKAKLLSGEGKDAVEETGGSAIEEGDHQVDLKKRYDPKNKQRKSSFGDERPSREVVTGWDLLDNNDVNFLMAFGMSFGAMAVAGWYWGVSLWTIVPGGAAI